MHTETLRLWAAGLLRASGVVLLDTVPDTRLMTRLRQCLERGTDKVADLHLWRLGPGHLGLVASIVSDAPQSPDAYKARLTGVAGLSHVTIEVHACPHAEPPPSSAGSPVALAG